MAVRNVVEDRRGRIWVGTIDGLMSFPSHFAKPSQMTFETYKKADVPTLANSDIYALQSDRHGNIWVCGFGGGVGRIVGYDAKGRRPVFRAPVHDRRLPGQGVATLLEDARGTLWMANNQGLTACRLDGGMASYDHYDGFPEVEMEEARAKFGTDYEDFIGALQERMDKFAAEDLADRENRKREFESYLSDSTGRIESFEKRITEKLALLDSSIVDKGERVERSLADIDQRVKDFEGDVSYRFDSMGEIGNEIEDLERNIRLTMDQVAERLHGEYLRFEKKLAEERNAESTRVAKEAEKIRELMAALEKELNELKARAYDNVSQKLKMFEDEFFVDLKERSDSMDTSMEEWKKGVDQRMAELEEQNSIERSNIEKRYTDELRNRITELQSKIYGQYDKFESQIAGYQERLQERMNLTDNSLKGFEEELKREVSDIRDQSRVFFEKEFTEHGAAVNAQLKKAERELEGELKALGEALGEGTKELSALLEASRSDVTVWQAQVQQQFRQAEAQIQEEMAGFRKDVHAAIDQLKKEFDFQKEDLILTTQDERTRLKNEIKQLGDAVVSLENDLRVRTESALEAFRGEWDTASMEFQKKTKDLALEADGRIKEYRASVKDTQEKVEALQKRLFGRIEEEYQVLSVNLAEIDKKQKGFVEQTKIFDRADSLKNTLEENLEDLKAEVARVEAQGKELKELDRKFLQIKKLADEVSAKLTRFLAEKRRIEEMEGDFKKLINISAATDVKLDQVTASHDTLQAIQARIRNLEEQEKEVIAKYERLETKKGILDATIEGIARGFQQLQTLEVGVKGIEESLSTIPQQIREVAAQIEQLAKGKEKAEAAVKTVQGLDSLLSDLEQRTEKLQKAREWLAKTETRLEEINKQAQDQVKLLGSLLKEEGGREKKEKGAPTMNVRDMVIRLARQGWDVNEIAQATKLSRGEVELILELGTKKN
jgi:chromosome segregation ATPase